MRPASCTKSNDDVVELVVVTGDVLDVLLVVAPLLVELPEIELCDVVGDVLDAEIEVVEPADVLVLVLAPTREGTGIVEYVDGAAMFDNTIYSSVQRQNASGSRTHVHPL